MRIVSMEKGDNVRQIIERFAMATQQIQVCLKEQGKFTYRSRDAHQNALQALISCIRTTLVGF